MSDILIRDLSDDIVTAIDARAATLGISRVEYIRRRLAQDATTAQVSVSADDLTRFSDTFADLADPDTMAGAWE